MTAYLAQCTRPFDGTHKLVAPEHDAARHIQQYIDCKEKNSQLSACLLLEQSQCRQAQQLLHGMYRIDTAGSGLPHGHMVFYDPPRVTASLSKATALNCATSRYMTVKGIIHGVQLHAAIDTQASHCFIDRAFVKGIVYAPYPLTHQFNWPMAPYSVLLNPASSNSSLTITSPTCRRSLCHLPRSKATMQRPC